MIRSKTLLISLFFLVFLIACDKSIFREKFEDCNTSRYATEKDSISVKPTDKDIIYVLKKYLNREDLKKINGFIGLQIIVDRDGTSCLLSLENTTSISTKKLGLKGIIDQYLFWQKPAKRTSIVIALLFNGIEIEKTRISFSGNNEAQTIN